MINNQGDGSQETYFTSCRLVYISWLLSQYLQSDAGMHQNLFSISPNTTSIWCILVSHPHTSEPSIVGFFRPPIRNGLPSARFLSFTRGVV